MAAWISSRSEASFGTGRVENRLFVSIMTEPLGSEQWRQVRVRERGAPSLSQWR
jgi:hypothetical protein